MIVADDEWTKLTSEQFELLCRDLLLHLEFDRVDRMGGPGDKGRDLVCSKNIRFGPGISSVYTFIVQCKNTPRGIDQSRVLNDLAKAIEHRCHFWWLMTSARLSPNDKDWMNSLKTSKYGFGIDVVDRGLIQSWLAQFPDVLAHYFPGITELIHKHQGAAMKLMAKGKYSEAASLLHRTDDGIHARFPYLLACCYSMLADLDAERREENLTESIEQLTASVSRHYLGFLEREFGWPRGKALFEVHRDPELQAVRTIWPVRFKELYPEPPRGAGGCFPRSVHVTMSDGTTRTLANIHPGDRVRAVFGDSRCADAASTVTSLTACCTWHVVEIDGRLRTTDDQLLMTCGGWTPASAIARGDVLVTERGFCVVQTVRTWRERMSVLHPTLTPSPVYFVNGYCAHNIKY